ncbi:hypothetical protein K458DRAFT_52198 [Lentithecium fluviatile CBS 122367]|uniref:Uncharacterized protein n=1 Tax=Lentithecium fluviatile CBS 122367 TaxID=1168545 RepID=A0A6G1IX82_9PLEO|nr:hypothetical protein K458DRAFT_52198 [Lentithecium fluviatile CBS 122367]
MGWIGLCGVFLYYYFIPPWSGAFSSVEAKRLFSMALGCWACFCFLPIRIFGFSLLVVVVVVVVVCCFGALTLLFGVTWIAHGEKRGEGRASCIYHSCGEESCIADDEDSFDRKCGTFVCLGCDVSDIVCTMARSEIGVRGRD